MHGVWIGCLAEAGAEALVGSVAADLAPAAFPTAVSEPVVAILLSPWMRIGAFVWGLLWGSFANVLIHRLPRGMSIVAPRSRCPHCERPIASWDNIPVVSYLLLRGRCRHCKEPVAMRYLLVELLVGFLSFALYMKMVYVPLVEGHAGDLLGWQLWFAYGLALLVVTYIDLDMWIIPDAIVLPMAGIGVLAAAVAPDVLGVPLWQSAAAAATGYLMFAGIRLFYLKVRGIEGLGLGDAKLLLMVGAFTGVQGLVWCIGAGAIQGVLVSVPLLRSGRQIANTELEEVHGDDPELGEEDPDAGVMGRRVPFGPFLALAAMEYVLLREHIDGWAQWLMQ